jgi:hypothetical protein
MPAGACDWTGSFSLPLPLPFWFSAFSIYLSVFSVFPTFCFSVLSVFFGLFSDSLSEP